MTAAKKKKKKKLIHSAAASGRTPGLHSGLHNPLSTVTTRGEKAPCHREAIRGASGSTRSSAAFGGWWSCSLAHMIPAGAPWSCGCHYAEVSAPWRVHLSYSVSLCSFQICKLQWDGRVADRGARESIASPRSVSLCFL